jgi:DNA (cytosine-5)-methyltransferase 1
VTIGSLFSGIGGLELGLERAGLGEVLWQVEKEPFRREILAKHWPNATRHDDVRTFYSIVRNGGYQHVDVICGGFPCQGVSQAARGKNDGLADSRSGLWRYFAGVVAVLGPSCVVVENVASGKNRWLPTVRRDLYMLGYRTRALRIDASDVGAPHARARIFVVGYPYTHGKPTSAVNAEMADLPTPTGLGGHWRNAKPSSLRMDDGFSRGLDRVRALGDSVVPQCAELVGRYIQRMEK